jgi:hypothetical protein
MKLFRILKQPSFYIALLILIAAIVGLSFIYNWTRSHIYNDKEWILVTVAYIFAALAYFLLRITNKRESYVGEQYELTTILGVAVAGIIQVAVTSGPLTFWNIMIGVVLMSILSTYHVTSDIDQKRLLALYTTWGFTLTLTSGLGLQEIYKQLLYRNRPLPPLEKDEVPSVFFFMIWIVFSAIVYAAIDYRKAPHNIAKGTEKDSCVSANVKQG